MTDQVTDQDARWLQDWLYGHASGDPRVDSEGKPPPPDAGAGSVKVEENIGIVSLRALFSSIGGAHALEHLRVITIERDGSRLNGDELRALEGARWVVRYIQRLVTSAGGA